MTVGASAVLADTVSLDRESGECRLTIVEYRPLDDILLSALQERINACLQFIESGEIYLSYPQSRDRDFVIDIRCIYAPADAAQNFFHRAQQLLDDAGYTLRVGPLGSTYADVPPA